MDTLENQIHIREITPELITEYLNLKNKIKPEYQKTYKKMIYEGWFTAKEIAEGLNKVRTQRYINVDKIIKRINRLQAKDNPTLEDKITLVRLKDQKTNVMKSTMEDVFGPAIKRLENTSISYEKVYQLLGSLVNMRKYKDQLEELLQKKKNDLYKVLLLETYRQEVEQNIEQLTQQYFTNTAISNSINEAEKKILGQQAFDTFKKDHESEIQNGTIDIDALTSYLSQKKCI